MDKAPGFFMEKYEGKTEFEADVHPIEIG